MRAWSLALLLALACQAQAGRQLSWDWSAKSLQALNEPVANAPATDLVLSGAYPGSPQTAPAAVEAPAAAAGALPLLGALAPLGSAESAMTAGAPDYVVYVGPPQPQQPPVLGAPGPNGGGPVFPQLGPLAPAEGPAAAQLAAGAPSHLFPGFPAELARLEGELERLRLRAAGALGPEAAAPDPALVSNRAGIRVNAGIYNLAPAPAPGPLRAPAPAPRIGPPRPPGAPELPNPFVGRSGLIWTLNKKK